MLEKVFITNEYSFSEGEVSVTLSPLEEYHSIGSKILGESYRYLRVLSHFVDTQAMDS